MYLLERNKNDAIGEKIEIEYSKSFNVQWRYNAESKVYERYMNDKSQSETSNILGISQVQVSRKEKEILSTLRTRLM